jgi:hypothetical protein
MKKFIECTVMIILILAMIFLVLQTLCLILNLPESETKKTALVVLFPIIGAIITGFLLEVLKFWLQRNTTEKDKSTLIISEVTQKAVSISMQIFTKNEQVKVKNIDKYREDLLTIFRLVTSTGSAECLSSLHPLVEVLNNPDEVINEVKIRNALKNTIISLRENLGYVNTEKSNKVIDLMLNY